MKQRFYHREELDTPDEIVQEFQTLRDEIVAETNEIRELLAKVAKTKKGKK